MFGRRKNIVTDFCFLEIETILSPAIARTPRQLRRNMTSCCKYKSVLKTGRTICIKYYYHLSVRTCADTLSPDKLVIREEAYTICTLRYLTPFKDFNKRINAFEAHCLLMNSVFEISNSNSSDLSSLLNIVLYSQTIKQFKFKKIYHSTLKRNSTQNLIQTKTHFQFAIKNA